MFDLDEGSARRRRMRKRMGFILKVVLLFALLYGIGDLVGWNIVLAYWRYGEATLRDLSPYLEYLMHPLALIAIALVLVNRLFRSRW